MSRISMFSSSRDLREGLCRCLAFIGAAAPAPGVSPDAPWWAEIPATLHDAARSRSLALLDLAPLFASPERRGRVAAAFARVGAFSLPSAEGLRGIFDDAILSGRALKAHAGRDVYGASNKRVWDTLVGPLEVALDERFGPGLMGWASENVRDRSSVPAVRRELETLMSFDTRPEGIGHRECARWLVERLTTLGFDVEIVEGGEHPPILVASRAARGLRGEVVLYGHYDVSPVAKPETWRYSPSSLTEAEGRLWGRGVADNLGPLATRIWAIDSLEVSPALRWIIQGEEESGSPFAHRVFPAILAGLRPTLWLEETGYHDHEDGTLRLLARTIGATSDTSEAPDGALADLLLGLRLLVGRQGLATREEHRSLNKDVVEGGCPFNRSLPPGARYIALGVNDSRARIHARDESIPCWTGWLHREELALVFRWAHWVTERG